MRSLSVKRPCRSLSFCSCNMIEVSTCWKNLLLTLLYLTALAVYLNVWVDFSSWVQVRNDNQYFFFHFIFKEIHWTMCEMRSDKGKRKYARLEYHVQKSNFSVWSYKDRKNSGRAPLKENHKIGRGSKYRIWLLVNTGQDSYKLILWVHLFFLFLRNISSTLWRYVPFSYSLVFWQDYF